MSGHCKVIACSLCVYVCAMQEIIAVALGLEGTNTVTACIEQYMNTMAPAIAVRDEAAFQEVGHAAQFRTPCTVMTLHAKRPLQTREHGHACMIADHKP